MTSEADETLKKLNALNSWLDDVFGKKMRLSQLLKDAGINEDEIEVLKAKHLTIFISAVLDLIAETTDQQDGERRNTVMMRYYGLINGESETLQVIGDSLQLSRERIRQLVEKRLRLYRYPKRKAKFVTELGTIANTLLRN